MAFDEVAYQRAWRKANPEYMSRYLKKWRNANPNYFKEYHKKHNGVKYRIINHNRRTKVENAEGSYTTDEEMELFSLQGGCCHYCGKLLYSSWPYHIEHKIPLSRGGTNYIKNIALSCGECNMRKHTKTESEFSI